MKTLYEQLSPELKEKSKLPEYKCISEILNRSGNPITLTMLEANYLLIFCDYDMTTFNPFKTLMK